MNITPVRRIRLDNVFNLRDLGGIPTKSGKIVGWNKLFRSENLSQLTQEEWKVLMNRGVQTVIDLRSASELEAFPDNAPNPIVHVHCPLQKAQIDSKNTVESATKAFERSLGNEYCSMVLDTPKLLVKAVTKVVEGLKNGSVLYHCTAGKDRTGVLSATLLRILGADNEDIIADYQISFTHNTNGINKYIERYDNYEKLLPIMRSDPEHMIDLLKCFDEVDIEKHLIKHGLDKELIDTLRDNILVD